VRKLAVLFVPVHIPFVMRHEFIVALFTRNYEQAVPIFAVSLVGVLLTIAVTSPMLRAFDEFRFFRLKLYAVLLPLTCVALYAGIKSAGLLGAISAVVAIQSVDLAITVFVIGRKLGISISDVRRLAPIAKSAMASAVAAVATFTVRLAMSHSRPMVSLAAGAAVFGAVYLLGAFLAGAITDAEKAELLRFYRVGWRRMGLSSATEIQ
jgi:hypothetical protein